MSTRSIVARPVDGGFEGRYCHWDGYPTVRAAQVWQTVKELGSVDVAIEYALRPGVEGYWSSFLTPSRAVLEEAKPEKVTCDLCLGTGNRTGIKLYRSNWCNGCDGTGLANNRDRADGFRTDNGGGWVTSNESDMGTEWAYVLNVRALSVFERHSAGCDKAIGMFGLPAADADGSHWHVVGNFAWNEAEPNWQALQDRLLEEADARWALEEATQHAIES